MSADLDLLVGGSLGAWALRRAPLALVHQVVCLDDDLIALAAGLGHEVYAGDPHAPGFAAGRACLSIEFPLVLRPELIDRYDRAIWNLHPGLLPWGRGVQPVFWALWEGTPAGATLHELTAEVHGGPIVEQQAVAVLASDTGGRLRARVESAMSELYLRWLPRLAAGERPAATSQAPGGSSHSLAEYEFMRYEGRYEVARTDRERLGRCLAAPETRDAACAPGHRGIAGAS